MQEFDGLLVKLMNFWCIRCETSLLVSRRSAVHKAELVCILPDQEISDI